MWEFLINKIFVEFGGSLFFQEIIEIPVRTNSLYIPIPPFIPMKHSICIILDIRSELARRWRKEIRISVTYELLHFNSTRGSGWCITIKVSKIYNGKINVVSFVIQSCTNLVYYAGSLRFSQFSVC
jgi:hypothetical protein